MNSGYARIGSPIKSFGTINIIKIVFMKERGIIQQRK